MSELSTVKPRLNHAVFWPPMALLLFAVGLNLWSPEDFAVVMESANEWILSHFGWLFCVVASACVLLCAAILFSPFAKIRIGGPDAKPLMSRWNWFSITVCTTIAIGILYWSTSEPIVHLMSPPSKLNVDAGSVAAARFAISTMYVHWTLTPYAIYAVASLMFAIAYYNRGAPFSLGAMLTPLFGKRMLGVGGRVLDAICLYCLVAGMAASLGTGILTISGGLSELLGWPRSSLTWALVTLCIVATFIVSSASGLMKGIRILSDVNAKALVGLALLTLVLGPTLAIAKWGFIGIVDYAIALVPMNVAPSTVAGSDWAQSWTVFYWAVWMAWAPITACFLGRIAYGRTVREFLVVNLILPAIFSMAWMAIFSITAIHLQQTETLDLQTIIEKNGYESATFAVFKTFPLATVIVVFYLLSAFICFVTSADSNTTAMSALSSTGISVEQPEGRLWIKIVWGISVGTIAWVMISFADQEGIKMLSNLGGFPASILLLFVVISLAKTAFFDKPTHDLSDSSKSEKRSK